MREAADVPRPACYLWRTHCLEWHEHRVGGGTRAGKRNNCKLPRWAGKQSSKGAWELTSCKGFVWGCGSAGRMGAPK